jgi:heme oxygenase (biliverdin-producing, ferredoxin)
MTTTVAGAAGTAVPAAPLSAAMRDGSRVEHEAAEGSVFMSTLLDGRLPAEAYAAYLLRLRVVYSVMEEACRSHRDDPLVAAVHDPVLERGAALDADLDHWAPGHDPSPAASPATDAYRDRLLAAGDDAEAGWGGALVAHHYTRYLGDLSGGQAIGRLLQRAYDLDGAGTAFYAFPGIAKPKPYKDAYRARLDALGLDADDTTRVVEEVRVAFRLNQALLRELGDLVL